MEEIPVVGLQEKIPQLNACIGQQTRPKEKVGDVLLDEILQQLVNGLTLAAIYGLIAVGVSLFFGAIGIVNLAHGDVATFAAFSAMATQKILAVYLGPLLASALSVPAGIGVGAAVGWGLYRFA